MLQFYRKNEWNGHNKISILIKMSWLGAAWGWPVRRLSVQRRLNRDWQKTIFLLTGSALVEGFIIVMLLRGADLASQVSPTWSDRGNLVRVLSDVTHSSVRAFSSLVRGLIYTRNVSSLLQDSLASFFKSLIHPENERHQPLSPSIIPWYSLNIWAPWGNNPAWSSSHPLDTILEHIRIIFGSQYKHKETSP